MGFFEKLMNAVSDQVQTEQPQDGIFYEQTFTQNKNFRGHKRFRMTVYGYGPTEQGMDNFLDSGGDLNNANILLQGRRNDGSEFLDITVNGHLIGSIPEWTTSDEDKTFLSENLYGGKVTSVHVRIEMQNQRAAAHLFLKKE